MNEIPPPSPPPHSPGDPPPGFRISRNTLIMIGMFFCLIVAFFVITSRSSSSSDFKKTHLKMNESEFYARLEMKEIKSAEKIISPDIVLVKGTGIGSGRTGDYSYEATLDPNGSKYGLLDAVPDRSVKRPGSSAWSFLFNVLPLLFFGALFLFIFKQSRKNGDVMSGFGRTRARKTEQQGEVPIARFGDVKGAAEAVEDLEEVVEFLKSPADLMRFGAKMPRGVLLIGPPGCGKTLLARAVAGEAGVPFFQTSGSEFVEMFVGVGASRVRDLFGQARQQAPSVVFIDEIDAVGRHRGAGLGGGHDEREQTLNQILVEMDGFDAATHVIVLAATNRPDILDPALLRPGRFDRKTILDRPDLAGREAILQVHAKGKPLDSDVDLLQIARETHGFTGADLANLINEAAIRAAKLASRDKESPRSCITMEDLRFGLERAIAGPARKGRKISAREKKVAAYHEVGHALVGFLMPHADPPSKITCVMHGMSLGHTVFQPAEGEDRYLRSRQELFASVASALGGRVAELVIFEDVTTGAASDIESATEIARDMVTKYGMSEEIGHLNVSTEQEHIFLGRDIESGRKFSDELLRKIDGEIRAIMAQAFVAAQQIISGNLDVLKEVSELLLEKETLHAQDFNPLFAKAKLPDIKPAA